MTIQQISEGIAALVDQLEGVGSEEQFDCLTLELYWRAKMLRDEVGRRKAAKRAARSMVA